VFDSQFGNSVLLVDDSPMDVASMMSQLQLAGCAVQTTDSHDCALKFLVDDEEINVVILDHGITGTRVANFITVAKTIRPELIIVGSSSSDCRREFGKAGADCFLRKPWRLVELVDALETINPSYFAGSDSNVERDSETDLASSVTRLGNGSFDTMCLRFTLGERARIAVGKLEGMEGTVAGFRSGGRILLRLSVGVFAEIHQYALEQANCSQTPSDVTVRDLPGSPRIRR